MSAKFDLRDLLPGKRHRRGAVSGVSRLDQTGHNVLLNSDRDFQKIINEAEEAIQLDVHPQLIAQGSSGSYFVLNKDGEKIGVFKPKTEEPFALDNPKWKKFFQRTLCPCCFGRSCMLENQGYVSEAAASLVDERLGFHIVPPTRIIHLTSPVFNYSKKDKLKRDLPSKIGSMQKFMIGYKDAGEVMVGWQHGEIPRNMRHTFLLQFHRLVVLDYMVRNTDRSPSNWLIKLNLGVPEIAAIDHGLCFPHKHPDSWRDFPFYWAFLPIAHFAFLSEVRQEVLPFLEDVQSVETLCNRLYKLFQVDHDFNKQKTRHILAVMRGQMFNLRQVLSLETSTPASLAHQPRYIITPKVRMPHLPKCFDGEDHNSDSTESTSKSDKLMGPLVSMRTGIQKLGLVINKPKTIYSGAKWEDVYNIKTVEHLPYLHNVC